MVKIQCGKSYVDDQGRIQHITASRAIPSGNDVSEWDRVFSSQMHTEGWLYPNQVVEGHIARPLIEEVPDIKLKINGTYLNRNGDEIFVTHAVYDHDNEPYIFLDASGKWYLPNGRLLDDRITDRDLVKELKSLIVEPGFYWMLQDEDWVICQIVPPLGGHNASRYLRVGSTSDWTITREFLDRLGPKIENPTT